MKLVRILCCGLFSLVVIMTTDAGAQAPASRVTSAVNHASHQYGQLPLSFEANRGQMDPHVKFLSRGSTYSVFLTSGGMTLALHPSSVIAAQNASINSGAPISIAPRANTLGFSTQLRHPKRDSKAASVSLTINLVGAAANPKMVGEKLLPTKVNYFIGRDPNKWQTNIQTYARVRYRNVYPGIDLLYYGNNRQVEYDFVVAPGADANKIQFSVKGADTLGVDSQGNLVLTKGTSRMLFQAPGIFQEQHGTRVQVSGGYSLKDSTHVGFTVAPHDNARPLVIDPVLVYSTFLGGSGDDEGNAIAVDAAGNAYVTGTTDSPDFPLATLGSFSSTQTRIFLAKLDASGSTLLFADYFGGSGDDWPMAVALDSLGNAYVTGSANSADFPVVNAYQASMSGNQDAFLTKFSADGSSIIYSTYLGGANADYSNAVAVDSDGEAVVAGMTYSQDFPVANAYQSSVSASQYGYWGSYGFVTKFSADGSSLVYSSYLGGSNVVGNYPCISYECAPSSGINAVSVDTSGNAYVTGSTANSNFPVTQGAYITTYPGAYPSLIGFVSKFTSSGVVGYSTYLGGTGFNYLSAIAVDSSGSAYVTGWDDGNDNFPVTSTAICDPSTQLCNGGTVTKLDSTGSSLIYSTYLGANNGMAGDAIQVDASGDAFIVGHSYSSQFSLVNPIQSYAGDADVLLVEIDPAANTQLFATFLGGGQWDVGNGMALDSSGAIYIVGTTSSSDFPTQSAYQGSWGGLDDTFITKIGPDASAGAGTASISPSSLTFNAATVGTTSVAQTITVTNTGNGTLNINDIQVTGDFTATSSNCGSVAANGTCTVLVAFTPMSSGARSGTISLVDSAAGSPQSVPVGGSGIDFGFSATNTSATVTPGGTATYQLSVNAVGGNISSAVDLSCSGVPSSATCTVSPGSVTPGSGSSSVTVSITTAGPNAALTAPGKERNPVMAWLSLSQGFGMFGFLLLGKDDRRKKCAYFAVVVVLLIAILLLAGCGGGAPSQPSSQSHATTAGTYRLLLVGKSGAMQHSLALTLNVR